MGESSDHTLVAFEALFGPEFGHGKAFDLNTLRAALRALGDPQANLAPILHVAGTNGKGSTIAFMRAIAEAAGLRVHAFTKPHLFCLNERFLVAGKIASDAALTAAAERVAAASSEISQFDAQVAVAFMLFSETPADLVLLETGMGGREDSSNAIEWPAATIITPIGLDHEDALGATLGEIAAHKAGILKRDSPAIVARQAPEAMAAIEAEAARVGAPLFRCGAEWDCFASNGRLVVQIATRALDLPLPTLAGAHQVGNAGLACAAFLAPARHAIADDAFAAGIMTARWPARLQALTRGPLSAPIRGAGGEVWVDAGHNAHAAAALTRALSEMKARRGGTNVAIVGMRQRKDAEAFVRALAPCADHLIAVPLAEPHVPPETLAMLAASAGKDAQNVASLAEAMRIAALLAAPRALICGSFLLAAEALAREGADNAP